MEPIDAGLLILCLAMGLVMLAYGGHHMGGGGEVQGTAR